MKNTTTAPSLAGETTRSALIGGGIGGIIGLVSGNLFSNFVAGATIGGIIPFFKRALKKIFN